MAITKATFYKVTKTIGGVEYIAQFSGLAAAVRTPDQCQSDEGRGISNEKYVKHILDNFIVSPSGLTIEDFDDIDTLNAVVKFGREVSQGKFRDKKDEG